jgi:hypothetical protein
MKLFQARRHLYWLSEEVAAYRGRATYEIVRTDNQSEVTNPRTWAQWTFKVLEELPAQEWGLRVGDAVHNLRGALDHMVWQLALAYSDGPPAKPQSIQFPIYETPDKFHRGVQSTLAAVGPRVADVLEAWQPYQATEENVGPRMLAWLQYLSNTDKHRVLTVVGLHTFEEIAIEVRPEPADLKVVNMAPFGTELTGGAAVLRIEFTRPADSVSMLVTPRVVHAESIEVSPPQMVLPLGMVLESIVVEVEAVLIDLAAFLSARPS